jgi:hypothetical protein
MLDLKFRAQQLTKQKQSRYTQLPNIAYSDSRHSSLHAALIIQGSDHVLHSVPQSLRSTSTHKKKIRKKIKNLK